MKNINNIDISENENLIKIMDTYSNLMHDKYSWDVGDYYAFMDDKYFFFLFSSNDFLESKHSKYVVEFLYCIKRAWKSAGFGIIEEKKYDSKEAYYPLDFPFYSLCLRKRNVICRCEVCKYSEYDRCSNQIILDEFNNISSISEVVVESSRLKWSQFRECSDAHDVE